MAELAHDVTQRIVNVHWAGGLPVEFDERGHVLWQGAPLNMDKGTISMWFRVPTQTVEDFVVEEEHDLNPLQNMIPLLVFSSQPYGPWTEFTAPVIGQIGQIVNGIYESTPYHGKVPGPTWQLPYWPCLIALYIHQDKRATLAVVLQTKDIGLPEYTNSALIAAEFATFETPPYGGLPGGPPISETWTNASYADERMEWFEYNREGPAVTLDVWHHVLVSWDIRGGNGADGNIDPLSTKDVHEYVTAKSTMYCALDDENLTGNDLPTGQWTVGFADNEILCYSCWKIAGSYYNPDTAGYFGPPRYTVGFANGIKTDAVAVPAEPLYRRWLGDVAGDATEEVDAIKKIEVAELQIFSGLLLDTSDTSNRRAFVDLAGVPVDPKQAEKFLGRRPDILLHTTRNWQIGKNTGSIGLNRHEGEVDEAGDIIPEEILLVGQFQPTEIIRKWTPDPKLGK